MTDQVICEKCGYPLAEVDDGEGWGHYECKFCEMQNTIDRVLAAGSMYEYQVDHLKMAVMNGRKEIKRLRAELDKHRWIPVSERLPEEEGRYETVFDTRGEIDINYFRKHERKTNGDHVEANTFVVSDDYGYETSIRVTHWQPLPEPPEVER